MEVLPVSFILTIVVITFGIAIFLLAAQWKVFKKAGQPGWACIVPIYNTYVLVKIVGKPGWWLLLLLVPFVNIIFAIWVTNLLSKSFGKDEGFTLGLIFLPFIFLPILGFGGARYQGPYGDREKFEEHQNRNRFDFEK